MEKKGGKLAGCLAENKKRTRIGGNQIDGHRQRLVHCKYRHGHVRTSATTDNKFRYASANYGRMLYFHARIGGDQIDGYRLAGWLAGWLAGGRAGWLADWLSGWLAGLLEKKRK